MVFRFPVFLVPKYFLVRNLSLGTMGSQEQLGAFYNHSQAHLGNEEIITKIRGQHNLRLQKLTTGN